MAGFRDFLRMAMGWWSSVPEASVEVSPVDADTVWHAPMRETHGRAQQRVTITRCQSRRVTSRGVGRVTMAYGMDRNTTARIE